MLDILFLNNDAELARKTRRILKGSEFTRYTDLESAEPLAVLAALERERPDTIVFCAKCEGPSLIQTAELLRNIRASGYVFQILLVTWNHSSDVSRVALEFNVEWVVALENESELLIRALQRMEQKQTLIRESRSAKMRQLLLEYLKDGQRLSTSEKVLLFKDYQHEPEFRIAIVRVLPPYRIHRATDGDNLISMKGYSMLEAQLRKLKKYMLVRNGLDMIVCLMGTESEIMAGQEQLGCYLQEMRGFDQTVSRCAAWVFLGGTARSIEEIGRSYFEANRLIYERLMTQSIELLEQEKRDKQEKSEKKERFGVFDIRKTLMNALETFERQTIHKAIVQLKSNLKSVADFDGRQFFVIYKTLVSSLFRELEQREAELDGLSIDYQTAIQEYSYFWNIDDMFQCLEQLYLDGLEALYRQEENSLTAPVLLAKRYIRSYFNMPLTLGEISEYVGMNSNYFSDYFRKCMKMTFKQYQTNLRIRYAKQMLLDKQYTMEDIAEAVGYNDVKYFSRVFKQVAGISPGEYRKKYHILND